MISFWLNPTVLALYSTFLSPLCPTSSFGTVFMASNSPTGACAGEGLVKNSFSPGTQTWTCSKNRMKVPVISFTCSRTAGERQSHLTSRLHCSACCLCDLVQVFSHASAITNTPRTGCSMKMPVVPELTFIHRDSHAQWTGGGVALMQRGICGNRWHTDHNIKTKKKALGLRIGFMGRRCVSNDVRLNVCSVGFTCFQSNQMVCL